MDLISRALTLVSLAFVVILSLLEPDQIHYLEHNLLVDITIVKNATQKGAVCLDGSPPAYHLYRGADSGTSNWLLFIEGGGWCSDHASCLRRSKTARGSSKFMKKKALFTGILSNSPIENPDFYNWNKVLLRYCDGGLFAGDVEERYIYPYVETHQTLMYRGQRIWRVIMEDLMHQGMDKVDKALLSGRSAGGLAAIIHCNEFQNLLPPGAQSKCLSDAGLFVDVEDITGKFSFRHQFINAVALQNMRPVLPEACVLTDECLFPRYIIPHIKVPLFVLNSAYDSWQVANILVPPSADPRFKWRHCKQNLARCSTSQINVLQDFRNKLLESLHLAFRAQDDGWGMFIVSCLVHSEINTGHWTRTIAGNMTIHEAVGNWYFERSPVRIVDSPYPCNPCK